jgi:AcrR family transcriptional regulator
MFANDPASMADGEPVAGPRVLEAKQARSQRTLERLLDAAESALSELGVEGATVPEIAGRAGMSVGVVYRRFRDKDALLQAVYARFFERSLALNRAALDPRLWEGRGAREIVATVVAGMVRGHAQYRGLLRGLFAYAEAQPDPRFRTQVEELNRAAVAQVITLLLARRDELAHPDPEGAVEFVLLVVAATLNRWLQSGTTSAFPYADAGSLTAELTQLATSYLGIGAS